MNPVPDINSVSAWLERASAGDPMSSDSLSAYLRVKLVRRFMQIGLSQEEAQDLSQECLLDIIENLSKYDAAKGSLETWAMGFARTSARGWRRREYGRRMAEVTLDETAEIAVSDQALVNIDCTFESCLNSLGLIDRELLLMRFSLGLSFDEIAQRTDLTSVNARKRISRAVDKLRRDPSLREALGF